MTTDQNSYVTLRVWLPKSAPGVHPHNLSLENPNALMFFLEALAHGSHVFPAGQAFNIVAYQGEHTIGHGVYKIHFNDVLSGDLSLVDDPEPVKLIVISESGEITGVIVEAWRNMIAHTKIFGGGEYAS